MRWVMVLVVSDSFTTTEEVSSDVIPPGIFPGPMGVAVLSVAEPTGPGNVR